MITRSTGNCTMLVLKKSEIQGRDSERSPCQLCWPWTFDGTKEKANGGSAMKRLIFLFNQNVVKIDPAGCR